MAKYFKKKTPKHTLIFATVDAEEVGLIGAKYFVANHPNAKEAAFRGLFFCLSTVLF